jgi:phosphomannomutase
MEQDYFDMIGRLYRHNPHGIRFTYTAMHGVGFDAVRKAVANSRHECLPVLSQVEPDGNFPTAPFPNPEEDGALDLAIEHAIANNSQVILANDPDADRLAVAIPSRHNPNNWEKLTGDQVGLLLSQFLVNQPHIQGTLLANTIVSSSQMQQIAEKHSLKYATTLTGFKWLANEGMSHHKQNGSPMLLGYEEALGYSIGGIVQDKDGISALLVMADLIANEHAQGRTLWDALDDISLEYGLSLSSQESIRHTGIDGRDKIDQMMDNLRNSPFNSLANSTVQITEDYWLQQRIGFNGKIEVLTLPKSNVLVFWLSNQERVIVRPSGTEPKIKFYFEVIRPVKNRSDLSITEQQIRTRLKELWTAVQQLVK